MAAFDHCVLMCIRLNLSSRPSTFTSTNHHMHCHPTKLLTPQASVASLYKHSSTRAGLTRSKTKHDTTIRRYTRQEGRVERCGMSDVLCIACPQHALLTMPVIELVGADIAAATHPWQAASSMSNQP